MVLTCCNACTCCCINCCCLPTDMTKFRALTGFVLFIITLVLMFLAFVFVFFAFQGGSKSINGILNVGCAAQSMV